MARIGLLVSVSTATLVTPSCWAASVQVSLQGALTDLVPKIGKPALPVRRAVDEAKLGGVEAGPGVRNQKNATDGTVAALLEGKPKTSNAQCATHTLFNVGLPRTGTTSVATYLERLGYKSYHTIRTGVCSECYNISEFDDCRNKASCGFYERLGAGSSSMHTSFEDHPTFGLACPLATRFRDAKFIILSRPFEAYSDSVHYMMCKWVLSDCGAGLSYVANADYLQIQEKMYGMDNLFVDFCKTAAKRPKLCHEDGRSATAKREWASTGFREKFLTIHSAHREKVQKCVPRDRLLDMTLGVGDNAHQIHAFLGCKDKVPEFPHLNH